MTPQNDEYWMKLALKEAGYAYEDDEVPIGAVIVCNGKAIGKGYNQTERLNDVTAHAEMIAITAAANYLGAKFLEECTLYVTVEPCPMCAAGRLLAVWREDVSPQDRDQPWHTGA
jgi:tRNA(adenine34) deaminase